MYLTFNDGVDFYQIFMSIFNLCLPLSRIVLKLYPLDPGTHLVVYIQMLQTMSRQYLKSSTKIVQSMT